MLNLNFLSDNRIVSPHLFIDMVQNSCIIMAKYGSCNK